MKYAKILAYIFTIFTGIWIVVDTVIWLTKGSDEVSIFLLIARFVFVLVLYIIIWKTVITRRHT